MFTRISSIVVGAGLLASCSDADGPTSLDKGQTQISCALEGKHDFSRDCNIQRGESEAGMVLTLSGPSGSFRRLLVTTDGRGVIAADGAEAAVVTPIDSGMIEVSLGSDRYRLPATVKPLSSVQP
jgi:hypothetical protein